MMVIAMIREIADLARRIAEVERRMAAAARSGVVSHVDPANGLVRLDLGGGMLSPWVPYVQTAGALKLHSPPSVGQQMMLSAPSGETSQGAAVPLSFGGGNDSPSSSGAEHVLTFGTVRVDLTSSGIVLSAGGVTVTVTSAGLAINGGQVTHNGTNVGSTHVHPGILPGGSNTQPPQ